jgi:hypothetical protein
MNTIKRELIKKTGEPFTFRDIFLFEKNLDFIESDGEVIIDRRFSLGLMLGIILSSGSVLTLDIMLYLGGDFEYLWQAPIFISVFMFAAFGILFLAMNHGLKKYPNKRWKIEN